MSPTLFLIAFNELMVMLKEKEFEKLAFADDLAIVGSNRSRLIRAINIVE